MRRITFLFLLLCSMSLFATRYLVQTGSEGSATWRAASEGEVLVDLTVNGQSLNVWYNATILSGDEVWAVAGTYVLSDRLAITKATHSFYGGFAGTETVVGDRSKVANGYPWEFINETILDGNNAYQLLFANNFYLNVFFDGLTLTNSNSSSGAAFYRHGVTLQNCKIINNIGTADGGGVRFFNGGNVINSYIAGNVATNTGAGIYSNNGSTFNSLISGCIIENNRAKKVATDATSGGAGVRTQGIGAGKTDVVNCIIRGNKGLGDDNTTTIKGGAIYAAATNNNYTNCLVYNNLGESAIYATVGNFTNLTIVNNIGSVYIASTSANYNVSNCIIWGNKTDGTGETNIGVAGITDYTQNNNLVVNNTAVYPALAALVNQSDNITLELNNDSQEGAKGPGFVAPTTFWGAPTNSEQTDEYLAANWTIKYTSGCLNLGKTIASVTSDLNGLTRPQGAAYDIGAYELMYFNTTVTFNVGGTVNALTSGDILSEPKGKSLTFTITPTGGQQIASVKYNNVEVKEELVDGVYTAAALADNATLVVEFSPTTYVIENHKEFSVFANGNLLELRGVVAGDDINVYSITGARIFNTKALNTDISVPVARGIYLVKVAEKVKKVVVE